MVSSVRIIFFFFFKQKTAYEMRISDWSSDVCSSDLLEHVAHAAGTDTHKHLDEVGAGDGEERHVGLAGDGAGEQRLAGARRADQQTDLRDLAAEALELLRVPQDLDDLLQLLLRPVHAGAVVHGYAPDLPVHQARTHISHPH